MAQGEYVRSLFVTLRRSLAGKPWFHQRVIKALGLKTRHHCVEKPNNDSIRGMLNKVSHLVIVETDKMFYLRSMKQYHEQMPRTPITVNHGSAVNAHLQSSQYPSQMSLQDHIAGLRAAMGQLPPGGSAPLVPLSLQSPKVIPHLEEHVAPLPEGSSTTWSSQRELVQPSASNTRQDLHELLVRRAKAVQKLGLFHPIVKELNAEILELRQKQYDAQAGARLDALRTAQQFVKPRHLGGYGRGSRRGMLAQARAAAAASNAAGQTSRVG